MMLPLSLDNLEVSTYLYMYKIHINILRNLNKNIVYHDDTFIRHWHTGIMTFKFGFGDF